MAVTRMQQKRGTAAEWASTNPVLADGEIGFERDTGTVKVGNGIDTWANLVPLLRSVLAPTAAEWTASIRVLAQGEVAIARDTQVIKVGDGTKTWSQLPTVLASTFVGTSGGSVITASAAAVKPLVIKLASGQTANAFEIQNNAGTALTTVNSLGWLGAPIINANSANDGSVQLFSTASAAGQRPLVVRGASGQTASLAEFQNNAGTPLAYIGAAGEGKFAYAGFGNAGPAPSIAVFAETTAAGNRGSVVRGSVGQSANLAEFQNSAGTMVSGIHADGSGLGKLAQLSQSTANKPATDSFSTYPEGLSWGATGNTAGWPSSFGQIMTLRNGGDLTQMVFGVIENKIFYRYCTGGGAWSAFVEK